MQHLEPHLSEHWLHILILLLYLLTVTWSPKIRYLKSAIINLNILIIVYFYILYTIYTANGCSSYTIYTYYISSGDSIYIIAVP